MRAHAVVRPVTRFAFVGAGGADGDVIEHVLADSAGQDLSRLADTLVLMCCVELQVTLVN